MEPRVFRPGGRTRGLKTPGSTRNDLGQIAAVDELHHKGAGLDAVDVRDVWMIERGERPGLALEAPQPFGIGCKGLRQDFQRDVAAKFRIASAIDLAHAARAEEGNNLIARDSRPDRQGHASGGSSYATDSWRRVTRHRYLNNKD